MIFLTGFFKGTDTVIGRDVPKSIPAYDRIRAFEDTCQEYHVPYELNLNVIGDSYQDIFAQMKHIFSDIDEKYPCKKKGIFLANDTYANMFLNLIFQKYGCFPDSYELVGFDNSPIASEAILPITTVGQQIDLIAKTAMELLVQHVLGCFDGDKPSISQFAVYPLKMNIYGEVFPVGFVTSVCTYPEYTGQGIMKKLMYQSLEHMKQQGRPFALLYPYSIPLYHHLGWEIISNKISFNIKDRQIPTKVKAPGYVRRVDWDNTDFHELHSHFASITHGCLFRNALAWEEYWRWDEDDTNVAVYYNTKDKPCGFMVYLIKNDAGNFHNRCPVRWNSS